MNPNNEIYFKTLKSQIMANISVWNFYCINCFHLQRWWKWSLLDGRMTCVPFTTGFIVGWYHTSKRRCKIFHKNQEQVQIHWSGKLILGIFKNIIIPSLDQLIDPNFVNNFREVTFVEEILTWVCTGMWCQKLVRCLRTN